MTPEALYEAYKALWWQWAYTHPAEMESLAEEACRWEGWLCDPFASTPINQARALADLLNESNSRV